MSSPNEDLTLDDVWNFAKAGLLAAWSRTSRRMRLGAGLLLFIVLSLTLTYPKLDDIEVPRVSLEYKPTSRYNESKVALLIENRENPILAPLMLHFMSVVPPDWRFRFMGSEESVAYINQSMAIRHQVAIGKLDLTYIPSNMSTAGQEQISRFLTTLWVYETLLQPAEWLLVFQTDSILCANSRQSLNHFLDFDWVGAPWSENARFGGNGGLSLRRVSAIIDILRNQERVDGTDPEDVWLSERLGHRPGARLANGTVALTFSGESLVGSHEEIATTGSKGKTTLDKAKEGEDVAGIDDWRQGFYEPMGYHTGGSGTGLHGTIWGSPEKRKHLWDYCPEIKMTVSMDVAKFVPGNCNAAWKRDLGAGEYYDWAAVDDVGYGTEMINGVEYPLIPEGLVPW